METGIRILLLNRATKLGIIAKLGIIVCAALALQGCGLFGGTKAPPPLGAGIEPQQGPDASEQAVINPEVQRRKIKEAAIHSQDFELTASVGILSIEDFGTNPSLSAHIVYHVTEDFFLGSSYVQSKGGTTSYERLAGTVPLLSDDDRQYTYIGLLNVGWNALPGEIFIGKGQAYNSAFYFTGGMGFTEFGGDSRFTVNGGMGYRILLTRTFAAHFDFRDYLFDSDLLGEKKIVHNLEGSLGLSFYF
jgi:outer membrane beta-barrel protein